MKFARLQMDDGEIRPVIIQEGFWRGLTGDAPQVVVDDLAAKWGDELPHDEIRKEIQKHLEAHHKCKVILPRAETDDRVVTVEMIPTSWTGMLVLDLYVRANKIKMWLDVQTLDGRLCPDRGSELAFLQMLDRRRYSISLVQGRWEQYEAGSRKGIGVRERETNGPAVRAKRVQRARG